MTEAEAEAAEEGELQQWQEAIAANGLEITEFVWDVDDDRVVDITWWSRNGGPYRAWSAIAPFGFSRYFVMSRINPDDARVIHTHPTMAPAEILMHLRRANGDVPL